jgi:hypothetical protein
VFLKTLTSCFFIKVSTRRVHIVGTTSGPDSAWVTQQVRNLETTQELEDRHILLRDRDAKFSGTFDEVFRTESIGVVNTPDRAPRATRSRNG